MSSLALRSGPGNWIGQGVIRRATGLNWGLFWPRHCGRLAANGLAKQGTSRQRAHGSHEVPAREARTWHRTPRTELLFFRCQYIAARPRHSVTYFTHRTGLLTSLTPFQSGRPSFGLCRQVFRFCLRSSVWVVRNLPGFLFEFTFHVMQRAFNLILRARFHLVFPLFFRTVLTKAISAIR